MDIKLTPKERCRIHSSFSCDNFIDITSENHIISLEAYPRNHYIEIRKKEGYTRMYFFKKKSYKEGYDFGYWDDAEVVFALNNVRHD